MVSLESQGCMGDGLEMLNIRKPLCVSEYLFSKQLVF